MKTIKRIFVVLMAGLMTFAIPFFAACHTDDNPNPDDNNPVTPPPTVVTTELLGITLETDGVRTEYYVGQNFSDRGLIVKAETKRSDRDKSQVQSVTNYIVDSSAFRNNRVGEYEIKVSYSLGETTKVASYKVSVSNITLSLDISEVNKGTENKLPYLIGEEFSAAGIKAYATTEKPNSEPVTEDVTSSVTVDSSAYNKDKKGTYPIIVSYTKGSVTRTASFNVTVGERKEGLNVTLASDVEDTIVLSSEQTSATIDPAKIVVRTVDAYGNVITTDDGLLASSDYTVKVYRNNVEINTYTNLGEGAYQIWAFKDATTAQGYKLSDFAIIYVVDEIESLVKTSTDDVEQIVGNDTISAGWTFTATYASGKTVNLTAEDVAIDIDTKTVGENKTATVKYAYTNAKGEKKEVTATVDYTIKAKPVQEGDVTYTVTTSGKHEPTAEAAKAGSWQTSWANNTEDFDKNVTISTVNTNFGTKERTTEDGTVTLSEYGEVKGYSDGKFVTINVGAKATDVSIKVYATHNSKSAGRIIYLTNATTVGENNANVLGSKEIPADASTSPSKLYSIEASGLSAGTYYVYTNATTVNLYSVVVEYTIKASVAEKPENLTLDAKDISSYSADTATNITWADGVTVLAKTGNTVKVTANNKSMDGLSFTHRLQLGGAGAVDARSIKLELKGSATVTVYGMSGSSNTERTLALYDSSFTAINSEFINNGNAIGKGVFTVDGEGTFYLASMSGGFNVYYIMVEYN